jgi:uncharacterized protein YdeI (YjbR/CyaY-like superfamily)
VDAAAGAVLEFADAADWDSWLAAEHETRTEAWLRIGKRHSRVGLLSIGEALDVALCYGWIDGHRKGLDGVPFLQRYSRRRPRSAWSQVNVAKVEALTAAGRMRPAGIAAVAAAQADGRWQAAYASQRTAAVPPELAAALANDPRAAAAFERLGRSERYAVILPLIKTNGPQPRAALVTTAVQRLRAQSQAPSRSPAADGDDVRDLRGSP